MAIDIDKIKEDASGILGAIKNLTPGGQIASLVKGNEAEIMKVIRELLKRTPPGQAAEVVKLIVNRYRIDPDVAQRLVANEMADANIPTDPSATADEGYTERGLGPDAGAEDTSVIPSETREIPKRGFLPEEFMPQRPIKPFPPFDPNEPREYKPFEIMPRDIEPSFDKEKDYKFLNKGGRVGFQTGGLTEVRDLPPEFVEALGKTYAADLTRQAGIPSITTAETQQPGETAAQFAQRQAQAQQFGITKAGMADLAPTVAPQDAYQTAAYEQAVDPTTGLVAYQPFLTKAATAADAMSGLTGPMTTQQLTDYMSPYQQQVIDATMADYDAQAAKSRLGLGAQAVAGGAFGSGRHGIAEAEFDALSNRGRTSMLADLRQRGFQQASSARQQDLANQQAIANQQAGLGARAQDFGRAQIAGLGGLGAAQQAQSQAILDANRQFAQMAVQEPRQRLDMLGSGVMGLMGGMGGTRLTDAPAAPQASPLGTALGYGLMGADIYGRIFG